MRFDRSIYNIVMIHTARTWERLRIEQPNEEMPLDNISSTEAIEGVATDVMKDSVIQEFLYYRDGDVWSKTEEGMSDSYIENLAWKLIVEQHL